MRHSFQGTRTNFLLGIERHGLLLKGDRPGRPAHQMCLEHVVDAEGGSFVWFEGGSFVWFDIMLVAFSHAN